MLKQTVNTLQPFPLDPILVVNPITKQVMNIQPFMELLHNRYQFDKDCLVEEINDSVEYMLREPQANELARQVLACIRTQKALMVAVDSLTISPLAN